MARQFAEVAVEEAVVSGEIPVQDPERFVSEAM